MVVYFMLPSLILRSASVVLWLCLLFFQIKTPTARDAIRFVGSRCFYVGSLNRSADRKFRSIGQSFSALRASSLEYVSAVSSLHSLSEAMLLLSLTLFRLISSEHPFAPPLDMIGSVSPFQAWNTLFHTMTRYIIPYRLHFVKTFFDFFQNI